MEPIYQYLQNILWLPDPPYYKNYIFSSDSLYLFSIISPLMPLSKEFTSVFIFFPLLLKISHLFWFQATLVFRKTDLLHGEANKIISHREVKHQILPSYLTIPTPIDDYISWMDSILKRKSFSNKLRQIKYGLHQIDPPEAKR